MATRNIVPRATGEGGIGTAAKKWLAGYFTNLYLGSIVLGSDADGDLYVRSGGVLTRFPKGAANLYTLMNAAGTLPEYAVPFKLVNISKNMADAAGTDAITSVGFKPSHFIFISRSNQGQGMGFDNGTYARCSIIAGLGAAIEYTGQVTRSVWGSDNYGVTNMRGYVSALGSDGFSITYDKTGSPAGTLNIDGFVYR